MECEEGSGRVSLAEPVTLSCLVWLVIVILIAIFAPKDSTAPMSLNDQLSQMQHWSRGSYR